MFSSMPMECISINKEGVMLYQDKKGYEDYWRKHQVSPIARDIWTYTPGKKPVYQNKLLSEVKTANRYGVLMVNHSII